MTFGLGTALARGQRLQDATRPLSPPRHQVRRVEALAPKQRADGPRLPGPVGLIQDALLVCGREYPPLGFGDDLGIGPPHRPLIGAGFTCRCTALGLASLALSP